jgi:hypothetical protein
MMRRCVQKRGVEEDQSRAQGSPCVAGIEDARRQCCSSPAMNCDGLAALSEGKGKGEGGGGPGPFIGAARAGNRQGVMRD